MHLNLFQIIALSALAGAVVAEIWSVFRRAGQPKMRAVRVLVLVAAGCAIGLPHITTDVARWVGIGRGADLVVYLFILATVVAGFSLYARCVRLERQITAIVRWQAIHAAECGKSEIAADQQPRHELPKTSRHIDDGVRI